MKIAYILKAIEGVPAEFQLLPFGQIDIEGEAPAFVDEVAIKSVMSQFARRGNDMVIDYEHQTLQDVQAPAAGWIKSLIDKGKDGLFATVEWTEKAKTYLASKEYRYFSPVLWVSKEGRKVVQIQNVALTNFPRINNLKPIMAKLHQQMSHEDDPNEKEDKNMLEKLRKVFGLAADAAEEKVMAAVEAVVAKCKALETAPQVIACKEVLEALGAKADATKEQLVQIVGSLKAPADAAANLSQEVARLSQELTEIKQNDLIQLALKEGKTSPAELDKWGRDLALKNPEHFKLIVLSRPAGSVMPVGGLPPQDKAQSAVVADEAVLTVAKMMGNTPEDIKKYGGVN